MLLKFIILSICIVPAAAIYGQPSFRKQVLDTNISIGYGLALADVDGDGKPDILLADKKQFVWYRNGDWKKFLLTENLTEHDNVCIAARDLDGDGKAEIAVGAQWNPGETSDTAQSGSVHYLVRPDDPTQIWKPVLMHHEATVHRMQWVRSASGRFELVVAPLHGLGNKNGQGEGSKILAYHFSTKPANEWTIDTLEGNMHMTHNFLRNEMTKSTAVFIAGKEGIIQRIENANGKSTRTALTNHGAGEIAAGKGINGGNYIATIEPMHGNELAVYTNNYAQRILLDSTLKEGHALATADFIHKGYQQVLAGWRNPNTQGKVGLKLYAPKDKQGNQWDSFWIDENGMACEDVKVLDLNADGKPDIVASGRATHNVVIYWNK